MLFYNIVEDKVPGTSEVWLPPGPPAEDQQGDHHESGGDDANYPDDMPEVRNGLGGECPGTQSSS